MPSVPYLLDENKIRKLLLIRDMTQGQLAKFCNVEERTVARWIRTDSKQIGKRVNGRTLELIASALQVGFIDIISNEENNKKEMTKTAEDEIAILQSRGRRPILDIIQQEWDQISFYLGCIHMSHIPPTGYFKLFKNEQTKKHYFAHIIIQPRVTAKSYIFTFAYSIGTIRIEYGDIKIDGDTVELISYFTSQNDKCHRNKDGSISVWTWFGEDVVPFTVSCLKLFDLHVDTQLVRTIPAASYETSVCFWPGPHHIRDAKKDGIYIDNLSLPYDKKYK